MRFYGARFESLTIMMSPILMILYGSYAALAFDAKCNHDDLDNNFMITTVEEASQPVNKLAEKGVIHVQCKSSGQISWAFCQNGTWMPYDKNCSSDHSSLIEVDTKTHRRRKRFFDLIFIGIVCLFTSCSSPPPRDNTPPEIFNCPQDIYAEAIPFQYHAFVRWTEPTAWDSTDGNIAVSRNGKPPGAPFFEGYTTVGYYARDRSGNMATCNFVINIKVVRCPTLSPRIPDGYRVCHLSSDMVKGTICNYGCYQGHDLKGGLPQSECLSTGYWSSQNEPYCEKKKCPSIFDDPHDNLNFSCTMDFYFRSICTFSCSDGYDIPQNTRRTKVCLASGYWDYTDPNCIDVQPPAFKQCPGTLLFYPGDNEDEALIWWDVPTVSDNKDNSIDPVQISGPTSSTPQNVGTYTITYKAQDKIGNAAKDCSFSVIVKQLRCDKLYPLPYMNLNCTGTRLGSQCFFSCDDNAELNGTHITYCHRPDNMPYSKWLMNRSPFCEVKESCPDLAAPKYGALACDIWLGGRLCHPSCSNGYSVLVTSPLPSLLICLHDGTWLDRDKISDCYERQNSRRRLAEMNAEFYFEGDCHDTDSQLHIKETFLSVIKKSASWQSKCQTSDCNIGNIKVICGETSRKRSASNLKINFEFYFESRFDQLTSEDFEAEVNAFGEVQQAIRSDLIAANMSSIYNDSVSLKFNSLTSAGLEVVCKENSVPVFDSFVGCVPCSAGTYFDVRLKTCVPCQKGYYQPEAASNSCIICPPKQTTADIAATSLTDCEDACVPGTSSTTGLPPCVDCDIGFYEDSYGSVSCKRCPGNTITTSEGKLSSSDCHDFDIVFPHASQETYTTLTFNSVSIETPFVISIHVKNNPESIGSIVKLSTNTTDVLHVRTDEIVLHGQSQHLQDSASFSSKWRHIVLHVNHGNSIVYLDGTKTFVFSGGATTLNNLKTTLGGNGFSGVISQFNIMLESQYLRNPEQYSRCGSSNFSDALVNWNDYAYSSLINCYIDIPSKCDDEDGCQPNPCVNGTCKDTLGGYTCICSLGFNGTDCEINIDDCVAHACQNNATCVDNVNSYSCNCENGYTGNLCETAVVDGQWSEWDNWTECSVSCGNGTRVRGRSCANPLPDNGGKLCNGSAIESEICILEKCRECSELTTGNHSTILCTNSSNMIICTHTCDDGYWYDQDVRKEYRCGNDTYFYWDFQTKDNPYARLPFCTEVMESPKIYVNYTAYYNFSSCNKESIIKRDIGQRIHTAYSHLSCKSDSSCSLENIDILNCDEHQRRRRETLNSNIGYTITLSCTTSIIGTGDCYFGLADAVKQLKSLESGDTFLLTYKANIYQIVTNLSTSDSKLDCAVGSVPVVAYCVPCSIGHYFMDGECRLCKVGTYQHLTGQMSCFTCPLGTSTEGMSSISIDDCNVSVPVNDEQKPFYVIGIIIGIPTVLTVIVVMILYSRHAKKSKRFNPNPSLSPSHHVDRIRNTRFDTKRCWATNQTNEHKSFDQVVEPSFNQERYYVNEAFDEEISKLSLEKEEQTKENLA